MVAMLHGYVIYYMCGGRRMKEKVELYIAPYIPPLGLEHQGKFVVVEDSEWIGFITTIGGPFLFMAFLLLLSWIF